MNPTVRGFFIFFTSFILFKEILLLGKARGYTGNYIPWLLAMAFFIVNAIGNVIIRMNNSFWLIISLSIFIGLIALVLSPVIHAMKYFLTNNSEDTSVFDIKPNYFLILLLVTIVISYFIAAMALSMHKAFHSVEYTRIDFVDACIQQGGTQRFCDCYYEDLTKKYSLQELKSGTLLKKALSDHPEIIRVCMSPINFETFNNYQSSE